MIPFTVLLLRPDYEADEFGQDTYLTYVFADDAQETVTKTHEEIRAQNQDPFDYHYLFCTTEHHLNLDLS